MKFVILIAIVFYWIMVSAMFLVGAGDYNGFENEGYSQNVNINSTGFDSSEIDSGGFFTGLIGIFTAMGRFIAFIGFGITPILSGTPALIFILWEIFFNIISIGFIISCFWDG